MLKPTTIAAIRFGYGFHPSEAPPSTPEALLSSIPAEAPKPRLPMADRIALNRQYRQAGREDDEAARKEVRRRIGQLANDDLRELLAQAVTGSGFSERLLHFWADHFTVAVSSPAMRLAIGDFLASAIRPHIAGSFSDMLRAVATHPALLVYLNQVQSIGPNSVAGKRNNRGLNENLAREILELHTIGVDGPYSQTDVRELALLLTGLSVDQNGFKFRPQASEPGVRAILGNAYGRRAPGLDQIEEALDDIAHHPSTATHIARKLLVHFVGPDPAEDWVATVANAYLQSDGNLGKTYAAMLADDRAWAGPLIKAKTPFEFVVSSLRAAGANAQDIQNISHGDFRKGIVGAMALMGQPMFQPQGPDGWPEAAEAWITPPGLAARIRWAAAFADRALKDRDPRAFLQVALDDAASDVLRFAVAGSEARVEGIVLTLASPEFNRR